jgi:branched-chain amino acid transport system substrate-binding protein
VRTRFSLIVMGAALATALAACSSAAPSSSTSQQPYRVVMVIGLTGLTATTSKATEEAMKISASVVNAEGGINGRHVEVQVLNDNSDATTAVTVLEQRLSSGPAPDLVIAGNSSDETLAMLPILTKDKILEMGITASTIMNAPSTYPYTFQVTDDQHGGNEALTNYFVSKGYKSVGVLVADDALGQALGSAWGSEFKSAGIHMSLVTFSATALDLTPELQQIEADHPDVILINASGVLNGIFLKDRFTLGIKTPTVMAYSSATNDLTVLAGANTLNNVVEMTYTEDQYRPVSQLSPALRHFISKMTSYGTIQKVLTTDTWMYDTLQLVYAAARQANSTNVADLKKALEHLHQLSPPPWISQRVMSFSPTNHFLRESTTDYVFVKAGPIVDGMIK